MADSRKLPSGKTNVVNYGSRKNSGLFKFHYAKMAIALQ